MSGGEPRNLLTRALLRLGGAERRSCRFWTVSRASIGDPRGDRPHGQFADRSTRTDASIGCGGEPSSVRGGSLTQGATELAISGGSDPAGSVALPSGDAIRFRRFVPHTGRAAQTDSPAAPALPQSESGKPSSKYKVGYDSGFVIAPEDLDDSPVSLKVNSQDVFRYNGFARGATVGLIVPGSGLLITNSDYFGIPRGRLIFSVNASFPSSLTF